MNSLKHRRKFTGRYLRGWAIKGFSIILVLALSLFTLPYDTFADGSLVIGTPYTGIEAKAGETVEFQLKIENNTSNSQNVDLLVSSIPENWGWNLKGNGRTAYKVFIDNNSYINADFAINIPEEAENGDYKVVVEARGNGTSGKLTLSISLKEAARQESRLSAEYPALEGIPSTNFKYRVDLTNNSSKSQAYSLEANVPRGWHGTFSPANSSESIASISVEPNKNQGLDINIDPPQLVAAGEYTIPIIAKSADEILRQDLKVVIKGTYEVSLTTPAGRLSEEAYAGRRKEIKLVVINEGSADLKDVELRSWEPKNWEVEFQPKQIDVLKVGESKEVKAYIKPDSKALAGDYVVELKANTPESLSSREFRITVKTSTLWGAVGVLIIGGLAAGLYYVFNKYGRR